MLAEFILLLSDRSYYTLLVIPHILNRAATRVRTKVGTDDPVLPYLSQPYSGKVKLSC